MATLISFLYYVANSRRIITAYLWILSAIYAAVVVARNIYLIAWTLAILAAILIVGELAAIFYFWYPAWKKWKKATNDNCICLEDVTLSYDPHILPCGHSMHLECAKAWISHSDSQEDALRCPFCRYHCDYTIEPSRERRVCFAAFDGITKIERFTSEALRLPCMA